MYSSTKPYPPAWLPNQVGFKFVGILKDGSRVNCEVVWDQARTIHTVSGCAYTDLAGWVAHPNKGV